MSTGNEKINAVFDHLRWTIPPFEDNNASHARIASVHEFFHNELNNITSYGSVLQAYAYLSNEGSEKKSYYTQMLSELALRSKIAHESYATWLAITVHKKDIKSQLHEEILEKNIEYSYYYNCADNLVNQLKSIFIRQQVLSASIRICFQSSTIACYVLENLENFDFSQIRNKEFPDARFTYLLENLPKTFFTNSISVYLAELVGNDYELLNDAINGIERSELVLMENNHIALGLMLKIYNDLKNHFDTLNSKSLGNLDHMSYFEKILKEIGRIAPFEFSNGPIVQGETPFDTERNVLAGFENETRNISDTKPHCRIIHFSKLEDSQQSYPLHRLLESKESIIITARVGAFMVDQYQYEYPEDREYFTNKSEPFVAIRWSEIKKGEKIIYYCAFEDEAQLQDFLNLDENKNKIVLCYVSFCAANFHEKWSNKWLKILDTYAGFTCTLLDFSPLAFLEKILPLSEKVTYSYIVNNRDSKREDALLFHEWSNGVITNYTLMPGTALICDVVHNFILNRYPLYEFVKADSAIETKYMAVILHHINTQEYSLYFHNQNLQILW